MYHDNGIHNAAHQGTDRLTQYQSNINGCQKLYDDRCHTDHVKLLMDLNSDNRKSVYDMIDFLAQKEKGL